MPKRTIVNGLHYFQDRWNTNDPDFPFEDVPDCVSYIIRDHMSQYRQLSSGRCLLEDIIPSGILQRFNARNFVSIEDLNFDLEGPNNEKAIFAQIQLKQMLKTNELNDRDRTILNLKHYYSKTDAEIGEMVGLSRQHTNKVRNNLQKKLKEEYDG